MALMRKERKSVVRALYVIQGIFTPGQTDRLRNPTHTRSKTRVEDLVKEGIRLAEAFKPQVQNRGDRSFFLPSHFSLVTAGKMFTSRRLATSACTGLTARASTQTSARWVQRGALAACNASSTSYQTTAPLQKSAAVPLQNRAFSTSLQRNQATPTDEEVGVNLDEVERAVDEADVLIVGGGPAGLSAAIKIKQLAEEKGEEVRVVLLEKGGEVGK